ncbi:Uncharacterized protein TCM_005715 [Theobroma cacao]|uniref:Uncharacterized protein n=1 Tax=Theobroma cacao TaxID=3641 RepID=A0A061DWM1_THECC|nr:Uncharacterized protein TCM_005715 [Theobroma cacao]
MLFFSHIKFYALLLSSKRLTLTRHVTSEQLLGTIFFSFSCFVYALERALSALYIA